jgi:hypothetical protein
VGCKQYNKLGFGICVGTFSGEGSANYSRNGIVSEAICEYECTRDTQCNAFSYMGRSYHRRCALFYSHARVLPGLNNWENIPAGAKWDQAKDITLKASNRDANWDCFARVRTFTECKDHDQTRCGSDSKCTWDSTKSTCNAN